MYYVQVHIQNQIWNKIIVIRALAEDAHVGTAGTPTMNFIKSPKKWSGKNRLHYVTPMLRDNYQTSLHFAVLGNYTGFWLSLIWCCLNWCVESF